MSESSGGGARTCCLIKTWLFNTKPSETINCYQCWWRCVTRSLPRPSMVRTDQCPPLCRYCVDTVCRYCRYTDYTRPYTQPCATRQLDSVGLRPSGRHHLPALHQAGLLQTHSVTTDCHGPHLTSHNLIISPQNNLT